MQRMIGMAGNVVAILAVALTFAAAETPEAVPGSRLQRFVENARCYKSLTRFAHKPNFRILPVEDLKYRDKFFWLVDGEQRIGLLNLGCGEIELFRFFPPAGGVKVAYEMPVHYHWATLRGPRITIVPQGTWSGNGKMERLQETGETIRLRYSEKMNDKETEMTHEFILRFDSVFGYILDCAFELHADKPTAFEYGNLLAGGLADSRDDRKRYQKCIWTRRDSVLCYMFQNPRSIMQALGNEWRDLPKDNGFVGFVAERDMNPFLEVTRSEPHTTMVTCSVWYDQHLLATAPEEKGEDGRYHTATAYRMLSLPLPVAKELEDAARAMLPVPEKGGPMGFRQGVLNDMETPIPAGTLYNGCMWGHSARLDAQIGRSGTNSIRIGGNQAAQPVHGGVPIHVNTGKRQRLSAWVRTRGVTGKGAHIRVNEVIDDYNVALVSHHSKFLTGDNEWTRLEIEFKTGPEETLIVPGLVVDGGGVAWFDDIELIELE